MAFTRAKPAGWTDDVDTITATQINQIDTNQSLAIDGSGGGTYTPTSEIAIAGTSGLRISGTGSAAWLKLSSRTVVIEHPLVLAMVIPYVGPIGNEPSARIIDSDVTATIGGDTIPRGSIISPGFATTETQAGYFILEIERPPDASTFDQVTLQTKGVAGGTSNLPAYTVVRWTSTSSPAAISTVDIADTHTAGNYLTNVVAQTLTVNASTTIEIATYRYGVLVKNPFDATSGSQFRVYSVTGRYTVTSHRF